MKKSQFIFFPAIAVVALIGFGCASDLNDMKPVQVNNGTSSGSVPPVAPPPAPVIAPVVETKPTVLTSTKPTLKVVKVDSEETAAEDGKGVNAVDGDPATFWHTQYQDATPPCPHEITIELVPAATIKGVTYLPRQDESDHGTIKDYEVYVSNDGIDFGQPVSKGTWENTKGLKTATFDAKPCRFIKLKALSEVNDSEWTSAAEISVIPAN